MAAPPSFSIFTATRNRSEPRTLHRNLHHATAPPRTPSSSSFTRATTDRASSAHHCTSHRPSSRLRTCNFEPSSGATRDHRSRTCNHRKHSRRRTTHHHLREPAPSRTPPAFRAAVAEETTTISCKTTAPPSSRYRERSATATQHLHFLSIIFSSFLTTARRHSTLLQQIAQAPHTTAPATVHLLASAPATSNHPAAPLAITVRAPATTANTATAAPRTTICANQRRHALHPRSAQQQQLPTPCLTSHHLHPCENPEATPPRRKSDRRAVSRAVAVPTSLHETLNAANPSLEREKCTLRHVSASDRTVKLVNWSKLQIWLNERGRIGNWIGIKLLIN